MKKLFTLFAVPFLCAFFVSTSAWGQVSITSTGSAYTQNFDALAQSGTNNTWTDNSTISGWYSNRTIFIGDNGTSTTGGLHSYGVAGTNAVTDRALGGLSSSNASPVFAVRLVNNTGSTITSVDVSFTGEEWRQNATAQILTFDYQVGASDITSGTWTSVSALNFTAPYTGTAGALDGNASGNFTNLSSTISVSVADGQEIWLRWTKTGSNSPGLAVDDFSATFNIGSSPTIGVTPTSLTGFTYVEGSGPSSSQSYDLSGTNLTGAPGNITVTAPTDYEVSTDNTTFSSSVNVAYSSATLSSTPVYVRLKSGLSAGNYNSELVTNTGGGASEQDVTCSGTIYKAEPTNYATSFASAAGTPSSYAIDLSWVDATGGTSPDGYLIKASTVSYAAIADPVDGTAESNNFLVMNVAQGTQTASFAALSAGTTYYFKIYPYTNSSTNINYKTDGSVPTTSLATASAPAASLLFSENFNYTASSDLATQGGWTIIGSDGTNLTVSSSTDLSYSGYEMTGGLSADITALSAYIGETKFCIVDDSL